MYIKVSSHTTVHSRRISIQSQIENYYQAVMDLGPQQVKLGSIKV